MKQYYACPRCNSEMQPDDRIPPSDHQIRVDCGQCGAITHWERYNGWADLVDFVE